MKLCALILFLISGMVQTRADRRSDAEPTADGQLPVKSGTKNSTTRGVRGDSKLATWMHDQIEVSAYDNAGKSGCLRCCGKWARYNRTASGTVPTVGRTIACNFLPFGTRVRIEGVGERVVEDRLSPKFGHRIDLLLSTHDVAELWGVKKLNVEVIQTTKR